MIFFVKSGVFMLSILNEEAAEQMKPHYINMFKIFSRILSDQTNLKSAFYVLRYVLIWLFL